MAAKHWKYHEQSGFMDHNGQHRHQFAHILKKIRNIQKKIYDCFGLPLGVDLSQPPVQNSKIASVAHFKSPPESTYRITAQSGQ